jgi:hypothetical protein
MFFMKKNNFFMATLFGAVALLGVNFEARGMENESNRAALIGAGLGAAALAAGGYYLANTATYKTYQEDKARKLEEKEKSDNPYLHAQPLAGTKLDAPELGNEKAAEYIRQYNQQRDAYNQQVKKNDPWKTKQIIDQYERDNQ